MKLPSDLLKLPLQFDSERLAHEIAQIPLSEWTRNPSGLPGNSALVLVSVNGKINDDFAISGPMQATKHLMACPYMQEVFASLNAPISRSRLLRLEPGAKVGMHLDARYHWFRRIRIHVPVITNPAARFTCNGRTVRMAAGEAWTFNSAKPHAAENPTDQWRINLVIDTKGSDSLNELIQNYEQLPTRFISYEPDKKTELVMEPYFFEVLNPQEINFLINNICQYVNDKMPQQQWRLLVDRAETMKQQWNAVFTQYGHNEAGKSSYQKLIQQFVREIKEPIDNLIPRHAMSRFYLEVISGMLTVSNFNEDPYP